MSKRRHFECLFIHGPYHLEMVLHRGKLIDEINEKFYCAVFVFSMSGCGGVNQEGARTNQGPEHKRRLWRRAI